MLAAKASLAIRVDALSETSDSTLGVEARAKLESRVRNMDENAVSNLRLAVLFKKTTCIGKYSGSFSLSVPLLTFSFYHHIVFYSMKFKYIQWKWHVKIIFDRCLNTN